MDRSLRRAGAAGAGAVCAALRSITISLAIAIVTSQPYVLGFTIRGKITTAEPASDLTGEASSLLEVKYDILINDTKAINDERDDPELHTEVIAINKTENNVLDNSETRNMFAEPNTQDEYIKSNLTASSQYTIESTTNIAVIDNNKSVENRNAMLKEGIIANTAASKGTTTLNTILTTNNSDDNELGSEILKNVNLVIASTVFDNVTTVFVPTTSDVSTIENIARPESTETGMDTPSTSNDASSTNYASSDYELKTTNTGYSTSEMYTMSNDDKSSPTYITESTTFISTPTWKKYPMIEGARATTTVGALHVPQNENMLKSETAQTRITLINILNMTPIPSLENLRQRFVSLNDNFTTPTVYEDVNDLISGVPSKSTQISSQIPATKIGIVSSRRGGYLDNTGPSTPLSVEATTVQLKKVDTSSTETFGTVYETETSESDAPEHNITSGVESQIQLVEDAMKEELLREETINDNAENANRYTEEGVESLGDEITKQTPQTATEVSTYDALSVKPITNDKKINTSIYAVNPNYKPLKKIDVQSPKQFVRDPDDNSWRNESISSLGIVFKPKNSSKSFKQVLKNKTETELNNTLDKDSKDEVPDLRVRLEKIAEVRKSKKKKTNQYGEVVYNDYDSGEKTNSPPYENIENTSPVTSFLDTLFLLSTPETPSINSNVSVKYVKKEKIDIFNMKDPSLLTTTKPKKYFNIAEYYDTTDEYDNDYLKVTKIDLKKFTKPVTTTEKITTQRPEVVYPTQLSNYLSDRRPTVQYFPPTKKVTPKLNVEDYDTNFQKKINLYKYKDGPKNVLPVSYGTVSPSHSITEPNRVTTKPEFAPAYTQENIDKNLYLSHHPTEPRHGYAMNDGNFNRASYVIKHYKDFINEAVKASDEDGNIDYQPFTESPVRGVTINELAKFTEKDVKTPEEDYEYDLHYRKDLINRFVDNFNQNSERFKVDFPILYNNSVLHRKLPADSGRALASSSASLRQPNSRPCGPSCDKVSVDLSPDYELHYYIPEQEQNEEIDNKHFTVPYRYRNSQL